MFFEDDPSRSRVQLTERSQARLAQRGISSAAGNLAVSQSHVSQLRAAGYKIRTISRFLNAVSLEIENNEKLQNISAFTFVKSIKLK